MLTDAGYQVLFVGGCVRNALLGVPVNDVDIATDAHPEIVVTLAKAAGLDPVPTGIEHGTITVVSDHVPFEVTTFRKDVETDGRRAVVAFATSVDDDARRRDFTMNALYATPEGQIVDPLGGLPDLKDRRVRFIEDADARIREDYLRILRFFRFHAWYGDESRGLDPDALAAIAANCAGIETLSRERIGAEMLKLLAAEDPAPSVAAMRHAGVLTAVLPGADDRALAPLVHLEGGHKPDALRRLAVIGGADVSKRLRLSRKDARRVDLYREQAGTTTGVGELAYRYGAEAAQDIHLLRAALLEQPLADASAAIKRGAVAKFPLRARDLDPSLKGPALGDRLKALEAAWIASDFTLDRDALLAL